MRSRSHAVPFFFTLAVIAGCASTSVTQQTPMASGAIARPKQILVYDFVAAPADVPADSSIGGEVSAPSTPPTAEQIETGRQLGALIAKDLVVEIQAMGHAAVRWWATCQCAAAGVSFSSNTPAG